MHRLVVWLIKYERKGLFAGFEIEFTILANLFLEHWSLFYVN